MGFGLPAPRVVTYGDSMTDYPALGQTPYGTQLSTLLGSPWTVSVSGFPGQNISYLTSNFTAFAAPLLDTRASQCVLPIWLGTNDMGNDGPTLYALVQSTIAVWSKSCKATIIFTIQPNVANTAQREANRLSYNALVRANKGNATVLYDLALRPELIDPACVNDTAIYVDGTHFTTLENSRVAGDLYPIISDLSW